MDNLFVSFHFLFSLASKSSTFRFNAIEVYIHLQSATIKLFEMEKNKISFYLSFVLADFVVVYVSIIVFELVETTTMRDFDTDQV